MSKPLTLEEIKTILPHRYPFLFIDRVVDFIDGEHLIAEKYVSANESFFQGHFPDKAIMPGVLILEALAQAGIVFAKLSKKGASKDNLMVFSGAEEVRFKRQVVPGEILSLKVFNFKSKFGHWKIESEARVGDELAVKAVLMAAEIPSS